MFQKDLKKEINFSYDGTRDRENESFVNESKEKCFSLEFKICVIAGNESRVVVSHQIFYNNIFFFFLENQYFYKKISNFFF